MIITELISGLGNQLFQYSAGRALSLNKKTNLKIDRTWFDLEFDKQTYRTFGLDPFDIQTEVALQEEIDFFLRPYSNNLLGRIQNKLKTFQPYYKQHVYLEPHFEFDPNFFKTSNDSYLSGYWQSEKYFKDYSSIIRKEFQFKIPLLNKNIYWQQLILTCSSISLHVRRTDMVNNPNVVKTHGSCSLDYYQSAATIITEGIEQPVFFIFSDDPEWCKANLHLDWPVHYIDNNHGDFAYIDMQLMSMCQHHITANSSFSWWGAWLNPSTSKRVISPKKWFADSSKNTSDLIPSSWQRI
jgi:hypothetical protein